jgi:hypothetical protein
MSVDRVAVIFHFEFQFMCKNIQLIGRFHKLRFETGTMFWPILSRHKNQFIIFLLVAYLTTLPLR